ncbi:MAG: lysyl oxidase family protein [Actinomycetota bacterium]
MRSRTTLILLSVVFALSPAASKAGGSTIDTGQSSVQWEGRTWTTSDAPVPDTFSFNIDLPSDYWTSHPGGGVEVALRWPSEYNALDEYVLDQNGMKVSSATGFPTAAESLILKAPSNGTYTVVVVPTIIQEDTSYDGVAQIWEPVESSGPLLPDLVVLKPSGFHIAVGAYSLADPGPNPPTTTNGCYADEEFDQITAGLPPLTRCLRFDAGVINQGAGPFELHLDTVDMSSPQNPGCQATVPGTCTVYQDVYDANGHITGSYNVGSYTFHKTHGHIHYLGFERYFLYKLNSDGTPDFSQQVGLSRKAGFCMIDTRLATWPPLPGAGARNHHFPQCNVPAGDGAAPTQMRQGIDRGWGDVYTWDLPGQFIDISNVPDGNYAVATEVNPDGILHVSSSSNNMQWTAISIHGLTVTEL